jgi:hypothetical protein
MLTFIGAGYPRTGTKSLASALRILGVETRHDEEGALPLFRAASRRANGMEGALVGWPAALHWRELRSPRTKIILTVRDESDWWESMKRHCYSVLTGGDIVHTRFTEDLHSLMFGYPLPTEYWYKRRYREHNRAVMREVSQNLLVMDIVGGDKWDRLCDFLGVNKPDVEFPWEHRRTDVEAVECGNS